MSTPLALLTEADKLAHIADSISSTFARDLAGVLRTLESELRRLTIAALRGSETALSRAVRAAQIRQQVQEALQTAGFGELVETATSHVLDPLLTQMEQLRGVVDLAEFTSADLSRIIALQDVAALDLLGQGEAIARAAWKSLAQGLIGNRPLDRILTDLAETLDASAAETRTLYDTTVSVFGRQVEAMKSVPSDVFAYVGPVDGKMRPFCASRVGKVFTRDAIAAMDNGQLPDVFLTGGGYNCRHVWQAVSQVSELRDLAGTGQRIADVERQLQHVDVRGRKRAA